MTHLPAGVDALGKRVDVDRPTEIMPRVEIIHVSPIDGIESLCYGVPDSIASVPFLLRVPVPSIHIAHTIEFIHDGLGGVEREFRIGGEEFFEVCRICCLGCSGLEPGEVFVSDKRIVKPTVRSGRTWVFFFL